MNHNAHGPMRRQSQLEQILISVMTQTTPEACVAATEPPPANAQSKRADYFQSVQPVLEKLFELYPHLFGAKFLPLKLGIFQELLANHPEHFKRDSLKAALGVHTRSTRYLQSIAAGNKRYDLQGVAVDNVASEHVYLALLELFRRRQARVKDDLRPHLRTQLMAAFEASGLTREEYRSRVQSKHAQAHILLEEMFAELDQMLAKQEALLGAFEKSGKTLEEFASMYGLNQRAVSKTLETRARQGSSLHQELST